MEHTKANFKALRETVGMSQAHLAKVCGIAPRSVRRWEDPTMEDYSPRDFAWDVLENARKAQLRAIDAGITAVEDIEGERGTPKSVQLSYWYSAAHFAHAHPEEDPANWQMANANARLTAHMLDEMGFDVEFGFPGLRETLNEERG